MNSSKKCENINYTLIIINKNLRLLTISLMFINKSTINYETKNNCNVVGSSNNTFC